jgi:AcrR family transcriptional regulator
MDDIAEPSRRDKMRTQTVADIKAAARRELVSHGGTDLSLRSVARAVGMTPSALYRYFASRDDLVTELVSDGFRSLAVALQTAATKAEDERLTGPDRWVAVARAHRSWALENPSDYSMVYGRPVPGYKGASEPSGVMQCVRSGVDVMFGVMIAAINEGSIEVDAMEQTLTNDMRASLEEWNAAWNIALSPGALAICLHAWTQLHGFITLEMHGHFPPHITNLDAAFDQQMRASVSIAQLS